MLWGSPWEAANLSPNRSRLNVGSPTDFKHEHSSWTREELVRNMRYLAKNSGFVREYRNTVARYSAPVRPQSLVEDEAWRTEAEALYADRRRVADVTARLSGEKIQNLISKAIDTDGEIFILKTLDRATRLPKLQLIECHRVGDFEGGRNDTLDGFKLNSQGRAVAIQVQQDNGKGRLIPMRGVMHIADHESASAMRGVPTLSHAINHRLDVEELLALEKKGVKDNAEIARIIRLAGGAELDDEELADMLGGTQDEDAERTDPSALAKILGGKAVALQEGEDIESFQSQRPNPTFTGFLDHLDRESAMGGWAYEFFVNPSGINAGAVRLILERVDRAAAERSQLILDKFLRPDWFFVIGTAIDNGELKPIKNWHKITGSFPKRPTVDAGRNEESIRRSIDKGLISPSEAVAERGKSFAEVIEATAQDIKTVEKIAKRYGCNPDHLFQFNAAGRAPAQGIAGTAPSAKPPKEDDYKKKK